MLGSLAPWNGQAGESHDNELYTGTVNSFKDLTEQQEKYLLNDARNQVMLSMGLARAQTSVGAQPFFVEFIRFYLDYPHPNRPPAMLLQDFQNRRSDLFGLPPAASSEPAAPNPHVIAVVPQQPPVVMGYPPQLVAMMPPPQMPYPEDLRSAELQAQLQQTRAELSQLLLQRHTEENRQIRTIASQNQDIALLTERLAQLEQQIQQEDIRRQAAIAAGRERAISREQKINNLNAQVEDLTRQLEETDSAATSKSKRLKKEIERLRAEAARLREEVVEAGAQATSEIEELQRRNRGLRRQLALQSARASGSSPGVIVDDDCPAECSSNGRPMTSDDANDKKIQRNGKEQKKKKPVKNQARNNKNQPEQKQASTPDDHTLSDKPADSPAPEPSLSNTPLKDSTVHHAHIRLRSLLIPTGIISGYYVIKKLLFATQQAKPVATPVVKQEATPLAGRVQITLVQPKQTTKHVNRPAHPCDALQEYELIEHCVRQVPGKQQLMLLIWNLRHDILVARYALYERLNGDDTLLPFQADTPESGEKHHQTLFLVPEEFVTFEQLQWSEKIRFIRLMTGTSDAREDTLLERVKKISLYGFFCGSQPAGLLSQCFARVEELDRSGAPNLKNIPVPDHPLTLYDKRFSGKSSLVNGWQVDRSTGYGVLAGSPTFLPVFINNNHSLSLLYLYSPGSECSTVQRDLQVLEDGEYIEASFSENNGEFTWGHSNEVLTTIGGGTIRQLIVNTEAKLLVHANRELAYFSAFKDRQYIPHAWAINFGLKAQQNRLLLNLFAGTPQKVTGTLEQLQKWEATCKTRKECLVSLETSYSRGKTITSAQQAAWLKRPTSTPLWHLSGLKFAHLKKIKKPLLNQWLWLLSEMVDASYREQADPQTVSDIVDMAKLFCGVGIGSGSQELAAACFQQLIEKNRTEPGWRSTGAAAEFTEGFSNTKPAVKPQIELIALRARLGLFQLTEPRFIPSLKHGNQRKIVVDKKANKVKQPLNLPPGDYYSHRLTKDLSVSSESFTIEAPPVLVEFFSGTRIITASDSLKGKRYYFIEPENPYLPEARPAFSYDKDHYSRNVFFFDAEAYAKAAQKPLSCDEPEKTGIHSELCHQLLAFGHITLLSDLLEISRHNSRGFKIPVSFPYYGVLASDRRGRKIVMTPEGQQCTDTPKPLENKPFYHFISDHYSDFIALKNGAEHLEGYFNLINEAGVHHSVRWKALYLVISNCGLFCDSLHTRCARDILSKLQSPDSDIWQAMDKTVSSPVDFSIYNYPGARGEKPVAKLTKIWVLGRTHKIERVLHIPMMKIKGEDGYFPASLDDPQHNWVHAVVLEGVTPEKSYHIDLFSAQESRWHPVESLSFKTAAGKTTIKLNLSVDKLYRVVSDDTKETSYIFFPIQKIKRFNELTQHDSIRRKLPEMPHLSWTQPIHAKIRKY